ncbi:MAG: MAPEG family protein [Proteobacteria bacterium]|nr:MAPEG family protein [Pseudomonadota bacterium]
MTMPIISAGLAGILLVLQQILMLSAGAYRARHRVGVGHEGDPTLERLVRRHGNLAENAAIFVVALALLELLGAPGMIVLWLAGLFLAARLLHMFGFGSLAGSHGGEYAREGGRMFILMRASGATLTGLLGLAAGGYLVLTAWQMMAM